MASYGFPDDFRFGTATASYQIEGHPLADGAAPSIWHDFTRKRGKIENGDTGDIACDHFHRYPEDIGNIKALGCDSYRFSVSWPRIVSEPGVVNQRGLDFYSKVIDMLLENDIEPMCTLFHWDAPRWFENLGGFVSRKSIDHAAFYAETLFKAFGDRVKKWVTINEPMVYTVYGYILGQFPPGQRLKFKRYFHAVHHILFAHAEMVRCFHASVPDGKIGIAQNQVFFGPYRQDNEKDRAAAIRMDHLMNRMYMDPLFFGKYPEAVLKTAGHRLPGGFERDLSEMQEPGDFVGINYYMRQKYKHAPLVPVIRALMRKGNEKLGTEERSEMWEVYSPGLYHLLLRLRDEYGNPESYITENGYPLCETGGVPIIEDDARISYIRRHLQEVSRAIENGVNVKGYYAWSLMDNFEWYFGFRMRFGLIRTDFDTLERTWKKSAYWYRDVIQNRKV